MGRFVTMHGEANGKSGSCVFLHTFPLVYITGPFDDPDEANYVASLLNKNRNSPLEIERNAETYKDWFRKVIVEPESIGANQ